MLKFRLGCLPSEQPLSAPQVAECSHIRQCKRKTKLVFIAYVRQRKPTVFQIDAAAVPVVSELSRSVLHLIHVRVDSQVEGPAESTLVDAAITEHGPELVKFLRRKAAASCGRELAGNMQKGISCAQGELAEVMIEEHHARIETARPEIIVGVPLKVTPSAGCT